MSHHVLSNPTGLSYTYVKRALALREYTGELMDMVDQVSQKIEENREILEINNGLRFNLDDGTWVTVRRSR